jgi:hypothetical protein
MPLVPQSEIVFVAGQILTLQTRIGAAIFLDTHLVTDNDAACLTAPADGPVRRFRLTTGAFDLPDILIR